MKLLVGLGNPGTEYSHTRHNMGFLFVDYVYARYGFSAPWTEEKKFKVLVAKGKIQETEWWLIKPQTYMNASGEAVKKMVSFYKAQPEQDIIVAHDDLDLPFGSWKIQKGKGPRVHNGLISLEQQLATPMFWRIRMGIETEQLRYVKQQGGSVAEDFILKPFTHAEMEAFPALFSQISDQLLSQY